MEIIVQAIKRGEIRELVSLAKKNLISCEVGAEWINISAEEFTKLVALDNPEVKIKEIARELVSNMSIEEMREISDDISRERKKQEITEIKEKLARLDKEFLGKIYKRKEEYKDLEDFYKIIAISKRGESVKALRIARPEKKWITVPRFLSDEDVVFSEDCFATLENIRILELQEEYQEVSKEEWNQAYEEFLVQLKEFSDMEIKSEDLYV